ncbi:hypothetical protein [Paraburkholderia youngii]|uniref:hypothetical protein n=1 Tax=Paraburkholderia youngii TaxID=2782701 RepID=UPI003D1FB013
MPTQRDEILDGAIHAEERLRAFGAKGHGLGELIRDLEARKVLPYRVRSAGRNAAKVRNRIAHESTPLTDLDMDLWRRGYNAIIGWLDAQAPAYAGAPRVSTQPAKPRPAAGGTHPAGKLPAPWILVAIASLIVGGVGSAIHYTPGAENTTQSVVHRMTEGFGPHKVTLPMSLPATPASSTTDPTRSARPQKGRKRHESRPEGDTE